MSALDELVGSWRQNPDAEATVALCSTLGLSGRTELMKEVGGTAEAWHAADADVMLAVGRMYLDGGLLVEGQAALVTAGKANAQSPRAFRYLGEVLLRRGDAIRAEKVLARAIQLGGEDGDLKLWHDRATVYIALQKRVGVDAVATEVSRSTPRKNSVPPPTLPSASRPKKSGRSAEGTLRPPPVPSMPGGFSPEASAPRYLSGREALSTERDAAPTLDTDPPIAESDALRIVPPGGGAAATPAPSAPPALSAPPFGDSVPAPAPAAQALGSVFPEPESPSAREVLAQLAQVGVFEARGGIVPAWEKPARETGRSVWVLAGAAVVALGVAVGATYYAKSVAEARVAEAASLADRVATALRAGEVAPTDEQLSRAFELDSTSPRLARLWLENRVFHWLYEGEAQGIEGGIRRARQVEVPAEQVAFGTIAAALAEGDVVTAATALPKWDAKANNDALYQLVAGMALERVGDARAVERYDAALKLDPKLSIAQVVRGRALLLSKGPEALEQAVAGIPGDSPEARALRVLAGALGGVAATEQNSETGGKDPKGGADAADEKTDAPDLPTPDAIQAIAAQLEPDSLPAPLRSIPLTWQAASALDAGQIDAARKALGAAIRSADTPDLAVRLGELSLEADDPGLARKATIRAIGLSRAHVPARILAARVALAQGRLDEAMKAIEGIDPKLPDGIAVRAIVAYEKGDVLALGDRIDALEGNEDPRLQALPYATALVTGRPVPRSVDARGLGRPDVLWGRVIAVDVAMSRGDLKLAKELLDALPAEVSPAVALRRARFARLSGDAESALELSGAALQGAPSGVALIERTFALLGAGDAKTALETLEKYPALLGPMTDWLKVLVDAERELAGRAKARATNLELPPDESPLALRIAVAKALVAVADRSRGKPFVAQLRAVSRTDPDVVQLPPRF